jgi:hypothetical protein
LADVLALDFVQLKNFVMRPMDFAGWNLPCIFAAIF